MKIRGFLIKNKRLQDNYWNINLEFSFCSGLDQRAQTAVSSMSTFPPMEQKLVEPLVVRSTLVVAGSLVLMHGSSTCADQRAPLITPRNYPLLRASSLSNAKEYRPSLLLLNSTICGQSSSC